MLKRLFVLVLAAGCATTSTTSATWSEQTNREIGQYGTVESVRVMVRRVEGNPAGGALLGAVIGGVLTNGRPIGVLGGAAVGGAASSGYSEQRVYELRVRFDDGVIGVFRYVGYAPFQPGSRVVGTPDGLDAI